MKYIKYIFFISVFSIITYEILQVFYSNAEYRTNSFLTENFNEIRISTQTPIPEKNLKLQKWSSNDTLQATWKTDKIELIDNNIIHSSKTSVFGINNDSVLLFPPIHGKNVLLFETDVYRYINESGQVCQFKIYSSITVDSISYRNADLFLYPKNFRKYIDPYQNTEWNDVEKRELDEIQIDSMFNYLGYFELIKTMPNTK